MWLIEDRNFSLPSGDSVMILSKLLADAIDGTRLYGSTFQTTGERGRGKGMVTVEVENECVLDGAMALYRQRGDNLCLLNFACPVKPGGDFREGVNSQEARIVGNSGLYPCLMQQMEFYRQNASSDSTLYEHRIIYSPEVPFFREPDEDVLPLTTSFWTASVISAAAPNAEQLLQSGRPEYQQRLLSTLQERIFAILATAVRHKHKSLVLGAWGCGAAGNDPDLVAHFFRHALSQEPYCSEIEHVRFSILDDHGDKIEAFRNVFA